MSGPKNTSKEDSKTTEEDKHPGYESDREPWQGRPDGEKETEPWRGYDNKDNDKK